MLKPALGTYELFTHYRNAATRANTEYAELLNKVDRALDPNWQAELRLIECQRDQYQALAIAAVIAWRRICPTLAITELAERIEALPPISEFAEGECEGGRALAALMDGE